MKRMAIAALFVFLLLDSSIAQKQTLTPSKTALQFYRLLKEKKYAEGFHLSVYRWAVEGLKADEIKDLESDFARTFSAIPDKMEAAGEQITGDTAVVFLKYAGAAEPQQVGLVLVDGEWLVGDKESLDLVRKQGTTYFFNARIAENENETFRMLLRLVGAETIYLQKRGQVASLQDLIRLNGVPKDIEDSATLGYKITLELSSDKQSFAALATPLAYGRTGRLSFYADADGIRAEDLKGQPASVNSPPFQFR
ncbi:MAG TPA: hypothetical protein VID27_21080 [Blastocatellia bacterium]|jgi:hypothetical protein